MPTIVGTLTLKSRKNNIKGLYEPEKKLNFYIVLCFRALSFMLSRVENENFFITLGPVPTLCKFEITEGNYLSSSLN